MDRIDVTPLDIRDYALSLGWILVREAIRDGLFVLNSPEKDFKQLIFPIEYESEKFIDMGYMAISKMSDYYNKPFASILDDVREVNDDVISLRYYSDSKIVNSLSFHETVEAIEATKQMLLTAACSVVHPSLYHKRLARTEATELIKNTRFRHTQEGSFIIKVSCPIRLNSMPNQSLFGDVINNSPISRQSLELLSQASNDIITAVELDSFAELFATQKDSAKPIVSHNLCDSIINLFDDERELPFELNFGWSRSYAAKLPTPRVPTSLRFPYSFKPKIEELKEYFSPEGEDKTDTFIGTVESLNGDEGYDGRRQGEVVLSLLIDSSIVNARVSLNADQYEVAYAAHGANGGFVKVKGKLNPGKRIRSLTEISFFETLDK